MLLLLLLPILVSGFIYIHRDDESYFRLHRHEGQYLYLKTAKTGLIITISSCITISLLNKLPALHLFGVELDILKILQSEFVNLFDDKSVNSSIHLSWLFSITVLSLLISYYYPVFMKYRVLLDYEDEIDNKNVEIFKKRSAQVEKTYKLLFRKGSNRFVTSYLIFFLKRKLVQKNEILVTDLAKKIYKADLLKKILNDSPMDRLLLAALQEKKLIMFTFKNRQVYVGKLNSTGEPNENKGVDQEICIIPLMSGYRNDETLAVDLITHYKLINKDIYLTLRQEEILSITEFDMDAYEKFKDSSGEKKNKNFSLELNW